MDPRTSLHFSTTAATRDTHLLHDDATARRLLQTIAKQVAKALDGCLFHPTAAGANLPPEPVTAQQIRDSIQKFADALPTTTLPQHVQDLLQQLRAFYTKTDHLPTVVLIHPHKLVPPHSIWCAPHAAFLHPTTLDTVHDALQQSGVPVVRDTQGLRCTLNPRHLR